MLKGRPSYFHLPKFEQECIGKKPQKSELRLAPRMSRKAGAKGTPESIHVQPKHVLHSNTIRITYELNE